MKSVFVVGLSVLFLGGCASEVEGDDLLGEASGDLSVSSTFRTTGTGYFPENSAMEGGFFDRKGKRLYTLQQFLAGSAPYVSVAMDQNAFAYGQRLRLREFNQRYGREIIFRVVDTGGAFRGKGRSRIDICVANRQASFDRTVNSLLTAEVISESGSTPSPEPSSGSTSSSQAGASCSNDGQCNPGANGSGLICSSKKCVAGCRSDAHCPGSTRCVSGSCR